MTPPDLSDLAHPGATMSVRVTPRAAANLVVRDKDQIRIAVTTAPEGGKANASVFKLLAKALGVPKSRLTLLRGAKSQDKLFRLD